MRITDWNIQEITGYEPKTTFYTDFSIADNFGIEAVKDTYNRAFKRWKNDYIYLTELVMALNWKIWEHYKTNMRLAETYQDLWQKADRYACRHLKGDKLSYYYRTID